MIGTVPYSGSWTMDQLAQTCTQNENFSFAVLTSIVASASDTNLATFVKSNSLAGMNDLNIVAKGAAPTAPATLLFSANIYVSDVLTDVDVYRLN